MDENARLIRIFAKKIQRKGNYKNFNNAIWSGIAPTNIEGKPSRRLMITLVAKGCEWARKGGPCTMCNYWIQSNPDISSKNIVNQFKNEILKYDFEKEKIEEIDVFNSGSFLNDNEVPEKTGIEIMKIISKIKIIKKVFVSSRPEYVNANEEKLKRFKIILKNRILEVGMGLESSDDFVRETCINKGFNLETFEKAMKILKKTGARALVYVTIKPAFLTEKESIRDAIKTAKDTFKISKDLKIKAKVAFEPVFIKSPSIVYNLYKKRVYSRVWLWSIIEILKQVSDAGEVQVGISPEGMEWHDTPGNCKKCNVKVSKAIMEYNETKDLSAFKNINCSCKEEWKKELKIKAPPIKKRISQYLSKL